MSQGSLPHRQLRKIDAIKVNAGNGSLPHRQLRNKLLIAAT